MAIYVPSNVNFTFNFTVRYTAPNGDKLGFNFQEGTSTPPTTIKQYAFPNPIAPIDISEPNIRQGSRKVFTDGFDDAFVNEPSIRNNSQFIETGYNEFTEFGNTTLTNGIASIMPDGVFDAEFGETFIYNLLQYVDLDGHAVITEMFGDSLLKGGVRYIDLPGNDHVEFGEAKLINTRADQYVDLVGDDYAKFGEVAVSPQILTVRGIFGTQWGSPYVQRNPNPQGWVSERFGTAWVSRSPRSIAVGLGVATKFGGAKIFDAKQTVFIIDVIAGGIFGDISAKNTRRIIKVSGFYSQSFSDWGVVESTRRAIEVKGFDSRSFGITNIYNKTPSIAPIGIYSFAGLNSAVGYRIRTLKPSGWYQPKFGNHTLAKTPELKPSGFNQSTFGSTWISNKTRSIYAGLGRDSLAIGEITVWHFARYLKPTGIFNDGYGTPRVEHGRRTILAKGSIHSVYGGSAWVSYAVRSLSPSSITYPNIPIHRVGGTQHIQPFGYIATLFGSRIIPENQSIYPQGFINPFGLTMVDLWKKYIKPNGFLTTGQESGHRFGTHRFWNLRQYIEMYYDVDSGLTPPKWTGWTNIENKNKTIGAIGSNSARISEPNIENKARVLSPSGLSALTFGRTMMADRVRSLKLQGMEAPYISGWSAIYNAASAIAQKGFKADTFGIGAILNTRRYFNRIGNFESLEMGTPMIADRIRTLSFEHRYAIAPPYIPIHSVHLYTRYIEEVGRFDDYQAFGNPSLSIHWNIITPRWTMRDAYGYPTLKNVTPELGTRGRNSEEFGQSSIRTQWRELLQQGSETVLWGRSEIAFRDRQLLVNGFTQWNVPRPKVTKTGVPPYYPQYIWLDAVEIDGEEKDGHGIEPPPRLNAQVSIPTVKTNVIFTEGFIATRYGEQHLQSNGILVDYGISMPDFNQMPRVALKNRTISVGKGIDSTITVGAPRLSPHTIYAVMEAPPQAVDNHYGGNSHYVNSDAGARYPGEVFGKTVIMLKHRALRNLGLGNIAGYGTPSIELKRRYIDINGIQAHRMGWPSVGDGTQKIIQFSSSIMTLFGRPTLQRNEQLHRTIRPSGFNSLRISSVNWVSHYHRTLEASGLFSQQMGTQKSGDTPFMWQGLRVGELVKGNYGGFENQEFGKAWISNRIREVALAGFESFTCEYDYTAFDKRMRVIRNDLPIPELLIKPIGFVLSSYGVPNVNPAAHYIRPDGNADQYRKGAF